jgi:tryptophan 7-halogenase
MDKPIERILVCGAGLAGHMTSAALSRQLPPSVQITVVDCAGASSADHFYGTVAPPSAYAFNLALGVSEPDLILRSDAAFCLGVEYSDWGRSSWIQCFQQQLPVIGGVLFHHYLSRLRLGELEPYLVSAMAARNGSFAHPPERGDTPLSRAEYGYQFDPRSYARLFAASADAARVQRLAATIAHVDRDEAGISAIRLADGASHTADLYIDCTGPDALLLSRLDAPSLAGRRVGAAFSRNAGDRLAAPCVKVTSADYGWSARTPLRQGEARLTLYHPDARAEALRAHGAAPELESEAVLGRRAQAWLGNCVAIGQSASVVEPLTTAPMLLLQRDIERLLSLIPVSPQMSVERGEFNRRCAEDYAHAGLFNRALFETEPLPDAPYWREARAEPVAEKLAMKLAQFASRGLLVGFDLEPFNQEDWTILHFGMGRRPERYDRVADQAPEDKLRQHLAAMRNDIERVVKAMPSHEAYLADLTRFLMKKMS